MAPGWIPVTVSTLIDSTGGLSAADMGQKGTLLEGSEHGLDGSLFLRRRQVST